MKRPTVILALIAFAVTSFVWAADPPELVNYQGVLRNSMDAPLDGSFVMTFRFFDALTEGNEILVDTHGAVTVSEGLFNVELGAGTVTDGSGPGIFLTLGAVFARHADLYLEVEIGGETLSPRTPVAAAGYALNARSVRGVEVVSDGPVTLWVDASGGGCGGSGCSDDNDGLSLDTAKLTIRGAIEAMPSVLGGVVPTDPPIDSDAVKIRVQPGTYAGGLMFASRVRNQTVAVHLLGDGIDPSQVEIDCNGTGDGLYAWDSTLRVSNVTIKNCDNGIQAQGGSETFLSSCKILNNNDGINAFWSALEINNCEISGNTGVGVKADKSSHIVVEGGVTICGNAGNDAEASLNSSIAFDTPGCVIRSSEVSATGFSSIIGLGLCDPCP